MTDIAKIFESANYREIGIGYAFSDAAQFKHYWTQDFGTQQ